MNSRRQVLKAFSATLGGALLYNPLAAFEEKYKFKEVSCQQYTWQTFYQREEKKWDPSSKNGAKALKEAGYYSFEPSFESAAQVEPVARQLSRENIKIHSFYVNSTLHDKKTADQSIEEALAIAEAIKPYGAKIVVTNPTPIRWGGEETKSDEELIFQAEMLDLLGKKLREMDMILAYHTHDAEMKRGAREFHHMLLNTSPKNVSLCLDAHWIYRGTVDSQVALFDIVNLYAKRIVELHLRQSVGGTWSESFGKGDIDYAFLAGILKKNKVDPLLVVEQAVEKGTPQTMRAVKAIGRSLDYTRELFEV